MVIVPNFGKAKLSIIDKYEVFRAEVLPLEVASECSRAIQEKGQFTSFTCLPAPPSGCRLLNRSDESCPSILFICPADHLILHQSVHDIFSSAHLQLRPLIENKPVFDTFHL